MNSPEILESLSPELTEEIFAAIHALDKASYRSLVQALASRKKLRAVYLEQKPRKERHLWMREQLSRSSNQDLADQVLQVWLLSDCRPMICEFLDTLKIAHDGQGLVENLPDEPEVEKVRKAVHTLLEKYPPLRVAIYLNIFVEMSEKPWPELQQLLLSEEGLKLKPATTEPVLP